MKSTNQAARAEAMAQAETFINTIGSFKGGLAETSERINQLPIPVQLAILATLQRDARELYDALMVTF
jgi:hypothetical protein